MSRETLQVEFAQTFVNAPGGVRWAMAQGEKMGFRLAHISPVVDGDEAAAMSICIANLTAVGAQPMKTQPTEIYPSKTGWLGFPAFSADPKNANPGIWVTESELSKETKLELVKVVR